RAGLRGPFRRQRGTYLASPRRGRRARARARRARRRSCGARSRGRAGRGAALVKIGIGAQVGVIGGPGTYARELIAALAREARHEYVVFTDRPDLFADVAVRAVDGPLPTPYHQGSWDPGRLARLLAAERGTLHPGPQHL